MNRSRSAAPAASGSASAAADTVAPVTSGYVVLRGTESAGYEVLRYGETLGYLHPAATGDGWTASSTDEGTSLTLRDRQTALHHLTTTHDELTDRETTPDDRVAAALLSAAQIANDRLRGYGERLSRGEVPFSGDLRRLADYAETSRALATLSGGARHITSPDELAYVLRAVERSLLGNLRSHDPYSSHRAGEIEAAQTLLRTIEHARGE